MQGGGGYGGGWGGDQVTSIQIITYIFLASKLCVWEF